MKKKILNLWIVILLSACAVETQPTPTAIVETQSPTATASPTVTRTPKTSSTNTLEPTATITEKPSTATQVVDTPTPTPEIAYTAPELSSQGILAYVQNDVLWMEGQAGLGKFFPVARNALPWFTWSPDGNRLLYSIAVNPGEHQSREFWVWQQDTQTVVPLYVIVPDITLFTQREDWYGWLSWSPDSQKILFFDVFQPDVVDYSKSKLVVVDLENGRLQSADVPEMYFADWMDSKYFYTLLGCGSSCASLYQFRCFEIGPGSVLSGITTQFAVSGDGSFLINTGQHFREDSILTVDLLHTGSNVVEEIYVLPKDNGFTFDISPIISRDNQMIAFLQTGDNAALVVIDLNGKLIAELPPVMPLSWTPSGGILALNNWEDHALVYLPLDGDQQSVTPEGYEYSGYIQPMFPVDYWSKNGRWYAFAAYAEETETKALFIWDVRNNEAILVDSNQDAIGYDTLLWMPDSYSLYYGKGNNLWRYFITTGESELVIPAP